MTLTRVCAMRGRDPTDPSLRTKSNGKFRQRLEIGEKDTSNTITSVQKDCMVIETYNNSNQKQHENVF